MSQSKKIGVQGKEEEESSCAICGENVNRRAKKSFTICEICTRPFHTTCSSLPSDAIKQLILSGYLICCDSCNMGCRNLVAGLAKLESRVKECESKVSMNTDSITLLSTRQVDQEDRILELEASGSRETATSSANDVLEELDERNKRSLNLKFTNVAESRSLEAEARIEDDVAEVITACENAGLKLERSDVTKCYRVGKDRLARPRPLIVRLENTQVRSKILDTFSRVKRRGPSRPEKDIRISPDLTNMQQSKLRECYSEMNAKNEKETRQNVKWIVSGPRDRPKVSQIKTDAQASSTRNKKT